MTLRLRACGGGPSLYDMYGMEGLKYAVMMTMSIDMSWGAQVLEERNWVGEGRRRTPYIGVPWEKSYPFEEFSHFLLSTLLAQFSTEGGIIVTKPFFCFWAKRDGMGAKCFLSS